MISDLSLLLLKILLHLDKPKKAEKFGFESKYGNLEKKLTKKRLYYDLLNSGNLRRTYEYEYLT